MGIIGNSIRICGLKVNTAQIPQILDFMEERISSGAAPARIVTVNANTIADAAKDHKVTEAVNSAELSIADGYSLVFFSRFYGSRIRKRAYGPDLMLDFLRLSEQKGYSNFFYGSTDETLETLVKEMKSRFPALKIAGYYSPEFSGSLSSDEKGISLINGSGADVLWVGLGGGKQEKWMYENRERLNTPILAGVGAAFDFLSGIKPQAPRWMRESGLEWLFRLLSEPKRLWKRYLVNNSIFLYRVGRELALRPFGRAAER